MVINSLKYYFAIFEKAHDCADYIPSWSLLCIETYVWLLCWSSPWWSCERCCLPVCQHCLLWPSLAVCNIIRITCTLIGVSHKLPAYKHLGNEACCMYVLVDIIGVTVNALFCTPPRGLYTRISSKIQVQIACCVFRYLPVCKLSTDFRSWRLLSRRLKAMYVEVL